jgi:hypothetical protein
MPPPHHQESLNLVRAAEIGIGLHIDVFSRKAGTVGVEGDEPGDALADGGGDVVVEVRVGVAEGEEVRPGEVACYEELELEGEVEEGW